jgi:tetratricopeptide (TPR) repeat protein
MTPEEMQKLISFEITKNSPGGPTSQQYQEHAEQYKSYGPESYYKTGEFNEPQLGIQSSLLPYSPKKLGIEANLPFGIPIQQQQAGIETNEMPWAIETNKPPFIYDQMKQQINDLQKKLELETVTPQTEKAPEEANKPSGEQTWKSSQAEKRAEAAPSAAGAKVILGPYETFASFSRDRFNQTMRAAEMYLKQGKYYRAADAYTLASLYKPDDPLAYAGKSHALFAAGEYMSSALFLSRALQIFPGYAKFKIDLVGMVGSRDQLESRVADVKEWMGRTDAPELQFLLAYVYYQMDRPVPAKEAIDAAYEKMSQSPAVLTLKKAIEEAPAVVEKGDNSLRITNPDTGKTLTVTGDASKK